MGTFEGVAVLDTWYPVGSPVDIRRHNISRTKLQGHEIDLTVHKTWISPSIDDRQLPVTERLGLVWTTLGRPNGPPQPLIEYYEVDRSTLNVSSGPVNSTGPAVLEDALRMLSGREGERGLDDRSENGEAVQDDDGSLLFRSHCADLGILGSSLACEARVMSPHSALFTFRHSSRPQGQEHRKDFYAVFCQPLDESTTIVHRVGGIVDLHLSTLDRMRGSSPFAPDQVVGGRSVDSNASKARADVHTSSDRSSIKSALQSWIETRSLLKASQSTEDPVVEKQL